jgi:exosome complex exonuclease RRP6
VIKPQSEESWPHETRSTTSLRQVHAEINLLIQCIQAAKTASPRGFPKSLNLLKPQRTFEHVPKNDENAPFKPLLTSKPHAIVPLEKSLMKETDAEGDVKYDIASLSSLPAYLSSTKDVLVDEKARYPHPYKVEIDQYRYLPSMYIKSDPTPYLPFESTTATFVDTPEALAEMLEELKKAKEIAIDLEHHDTRSYVGIVSLMQISTRNRDWIVDTLKPWRRRLECLNEVFADPKIIKVSIL